MDKKFRQRLTFKDRADVDQYIDNLKTRINKGEITGEQASIATWNAVISFGDMHVIWSVCMMGESCSQCPLMYCIDNAPWKDMRNAKFDNDNTAWLTAAKKFRAWMKRKFREAKNEN